MRTKVGRRTKSSSDWSLVLLLWYESFDPVQWSLLSSGFRLECRFIATGGGFFCY